MGFKKTNYTIERLGIELPEAYAVIGKIYANKEGYAAADFYIQTDRENALNLEPLEVKTITFEHDRFGNLYEQAYLAAKSMFMDWEDDIVTEEGEQEEDEEGEGDIDG